MNTLSVQAESELTLSRGTDSFFLARRTSSRTLLLVNLTITGRYLSFFPALRRCATDMSLGSTERPSLSLHKSSTEVSTEECDSDVMAPVEMCR